MRKLVTISMPEEMHEDLVRRLSKTRYASVSEYVRDLIRKDDTGDGGSPRSMPSESRNSSEPETRFIIKTANEWLQEEFEKHRGRES